MNSWHMNWADSGNSVRPGQPGLCSGAGPFNAACLWGCCAANSFPVLLTPYRDQICMCMLGQNNCNSPALSNEYNLKGI